MPNELPDRKYPLMMRDSLVNDFDRKFKQWLKNRDDIVLKIEVDQLKNQVKEKWAVRIYIPETTIQGLTDHWLPTTPAYVAVEDARKGLSLGIDKNGNIVSASFEHNGLISCDPHKIPIFIDPTILTPNDAQTVKLVVWEIVKAEIEKRKKTIKERDFPNDPFNYLPVSHIEKNKTTKGRDFAVPTEEPEALATVFRCHPGKFEKYLHWYDLKMAGLSFRLIALIESHPKTGDREQEFGELINRRRKPKIGNSVKGESSIREGYNIIYRAINRELAPTQEDQIPTSEKYNCPDHGQGCPENCDHLKRWFTDFNNKHKDQSLREQLSPF
jgi:hypothetical protein